MNTKKRLAAGLLAVITAAALVLPASAHGHHGGGHHGGGHHGTTQTVTQAPAQTAATTAQTTTQATAVALCPVEGCDIPGHHTHDGVTYCGYDHAGGVCDGEHQFCSVDGCSIAGFHHHSCDKAHMAHGCHRM